jgi:hypothetical protein
MACLTENISASNTPPKNKEIEPQQPPTVTTVAVVERKEEKPKDPAPAPAAKALINTDKGKNGTGRMYHFVAQTQH